ncbi:MAG: FHA domain-containing protein [Anaerolineaceae bacterium]|nr:FHA domain-containing protein [Anaerolineaceae bacterium]
MYSQNTDYPFLIGCEGPLDGQRWLIRNVLVIGRDDSCDIVIPDRQISRNHAQVSNTREGVFVEDMGSKNGTYHNNKRVLSRKQLKDGDTIQIGLAQTFSFLSSDATLPLDDMSLFTGSSRSLHLDMGAHRVWVNDIELDPPLSISQFIMLQTLYLKSGEVVPRADVINAVWQEAPEWVSEQALDALVRRLRDRLAQIDETHDYIVTVRGHGLRLDNPSKE